MSPERRRLDPASPCLAVIVADPAAAAAALAAGADALVFSVPLPPGLAAGLRARGPRRALYAALDGCDDPNLDGLMAQGPDGVLLRGAGAGRDVAALGARLAVCEAQAGQPDGATTILAAIGHSLGVLEARSLIGASPRLAGLGLDGTALAARSSVVRAQARGLIALAAEATGVTAFEILTADAVDLPGSLNAARDDGFGLIVVSGPAGLTSLPRGGIR